MEPVKKPMGKGRDEQRRDADESESGEKSVEGSEELRRTRAEDIDRAHPTEDHRRVQQRIDPAESGDVMVSEDSNSQPDCYHQKREGAVLGDAPHELSPWEKPLLSMFVHAA